MIINGRPINVESWFKQNALGLVIGAVSLSGVWGALQSDLTEMKTIIKAQGENYIELNNHIKKQESQIETIPTIQLAIQNQAEETNELKPIMADLAKSVQELNITLVTLNGALALSDRTIDHVVENQKKIMSEIEELKKD